MAHIPGETESHVCPHADCSFITMHLHLKRDERPYRKGLRFTIIAPSVQSEGWSVGGIVERKQVEVSLLQLANNVSFPTDVEESIFLKCLHCYGLEQFAYLELLM